MHCAAASAMRERAGVEPSAHEQAEFDRLIRRLYDELGPVAFEGAWTTGRSLTFDRATTLAGAGDRPAQTAISGRSVLGRMITA